MKVMIKGSSLERKKQNNVMRAPGMDPKSYAGMNLESKARLEPESNIRMDSKSDVGAYPKCDT